MKINSLLKNIAPDTFLQDYLQACGVEDPEAYIHADLSVCDNPWDYPNMVEAVDRLHKAIENDEKIGVLVD